jgi:glycosyltransferase involved in cell wall biosynthesis
MKNKLNRSPKVSVVICTYNRYRSLRAAVSSVFNQTYKDFEIIVVNDGSDEPDYYREQPKGVLMVHLPENTRQKFGYPCLGYTRNVGLQNASGEYVAFLDDDDLWLPDKLKIQISSMRKRNLKMSCTEGFMVESTYEEGKIYPKYNREYYWDFLKNKLNLIDDLPDIFNLSLIKRHNCCIHSSVVLHQSIIKKAGFFKEIRMHGQRGVFEDWDYWMRCLKFTDCLYIKLPLLYWRKK